jgi:type I site-specific restriction-modification system R (restriction) subunit
LLYPEIFTTFVAKYVLKHSIDCLKQTETIMGFVKGQTGCATGRGKGNPNKATLTVKIAISAFLDDYYDKGNNLEGKNFKDDLIAMEPNERAKIAVDLTKHVVPKAKDEGEKEFEELATKALYDRLFGIDDKH